MTFVQSILFSLNNTRSNLGIFGNKFEHILQKVISKIICEYVMNLLFISMITLSLSVECFFKFW